MLRPSESSLAAFALCGAAVLALGAGAAPASASRASIPAAPAPAARLRDYACHTGRQPSSRSIFVAAEMRALSRPAHLALRARLLRSPLGRSAGAWQVVTAGSLGRWLRPANATLGERHGDVWIVRLPVQDLQAPGRYRLQVAFRWSDRRGRPLAAVKRLSPVCRQPDPRPDLRVITPVRVSRQSGDPTQDVYVVRVGNGGRSAAGPFAVRLDDNGTSQRRRVAGLPAGESVTLRFEAPACSTAAPPQVIVDPDDQVQDADRANNVATVSCG